MFGVLKPSEERLNVSLVRAPIKPRPNTPAFNFHQTVEKYLHPQPFAPRTQKQERGSGAKFRSRDNLISPTQIFKRISNKRRQLFILKLIGTTLGKTWRKTRSHFTSPYSSDNRPTAEWTVAPAGSSQINQAG